MDVLFTLDLRGGDDAFNPIGRASRIYPSAHIRDKLHSVRLMDGEERLIQVECHGLLPLTDVIDAVAVEPRGVNGLGVPVVSNREFYIPLRAETNGRMRVVITTMGGAKYVEWIAVEVWR